MKKKANILTPKPQWLPASDDDQPLVCAGKLAFDTRRQAEVAAIVAAEQHGAALRPYQCRHCGLWHLTSVVNAA